MTAIKKLYILIILSCAPVYAETEVTPTFVPRSQGRDAVRKLVGVTDQVHRDQEESYCNLSALVGYSRSFRGGDIAHCLFGDDLTCNNSRITIQGSDVENRCANAWFADYFYLAPDYNSYFDINPRIQNAIIDLDLFCGLGDIMQGLYLRVHGPITWTQWDLRFQEQCDVITTGSYYAGYFDSEIMLNNQLLSSFADFARGNSPLNTNGTGVSNAPIGVQFDGLQYAKIDGCSHSRTGFADLRFELGYDVVHSECGDFGLNVQVAAPTGNRTAAELAFDPNVGNRNHWEVGAGAYGHYQFYTNDTNDSHADLYVDLNLTHVNRANEQRTFDLCDRPNSRYMLAMKMGNPVVHLKAINNTVADLLAANLQIPSAQFQNRFTPVANLTTLNIPVSIAIQADLVIMLDYKYKSWNLDLGYNLWARSCEKFGRPQELPQCCPSLCDGSRDQWALKGNAQVFGFYPDGVTPAFPPFTDGNAIPLSATECGATIHKGTNQGSTLESPGLATTCTPDNGNNCGVDNAQIAFVGDSSEQVSLKNKPNVSTASGNNIFTSLNPKFINCCDINLQRTKGISHKVFGNLSYTWDKDSFTPYLGVGFSAEFGQNSDCNPCTPTINCDQDCDNTSSCCEPKCCTDCLKCSLSQWSVWVKGGINFEGFCG